MSNGMSLADSGASSADSMPSQHGTLFNASSNQPSRPDLQPAVPVEDTGNGSGRIRLAIIRGPWTTMSLKWLRGRLSSVQDAYRKNSSKLTKATAWFTGGLAVTGTAFAVAAWFLTRQANEISEAAYFLAFRDDCRNTLVMYNTSSTHCAQALNSSPPWPAWMASMIAKRLAVLEDAGPENDAACVLEGDTTPCMSMSSTLSSRSSWLGSLSARHSIGARSLKGNAQSANINHSLHFWVFLILSIPHVICLLGLAACKAVRWLGQPTHDRIGAKLVRFSHAFPTSQARNARAFNGYTRISNADVDSSSEESADPGGTEESMDRAMDRWRRRGERLSRMRRFSLRDGVPVVGVDAPSIRQGDISSGITSRTSGHQYTTLFQLDELMNREDVTLLDELMNRKGFKPGRLPENAFKE